MTLSPPIISPLHPPNLQGDGGGFFAQDGSQVRIVQSSFRSNVATGRAGRGGGVSLANVSDTVITSTSLVNNAAVDKSVSARLGVDTVVRYRAGDGGAIFALNPNTARNSTVSLTDVQLSSNVALSAGGGVAAWGAIQLSAQRCHLEGNAAFFNGGGCALGLGVSLSASGTDFVGNHAGSDALARVPQSPAVAVLSGGGGGGGPQQAAAGGADASASCAAAEGSFGDGGALWVFGGSSASLADGSVTDCTAVGNGGAVFVGGGSSAALRSVLVAANTAPLGAGGAVLLSGSTSTLSLADSNFTSNEAFIGGFLGFESGAASQGALSLRSLRLEGNRAQAGALYGVKDSPSGFPVPQCERCELRDNAAVSYGEVQATPPTSMTVQAPTVTRTGDSIVFNASLTDGLGQRVNNFTGLLGELECVSQTILSADGPPVVRRCTQSALRGSVRAPYACAAPNQPSRPLSRLSLRHVPAHSSTPSCCTHTCSPAHPSSLPLPTSDGVARFFPVFLSGEPTSVFTLAVSFVILPGAGVDALLGDGATAFVNVSVAPCRYLEEYVGQVYGKDGAEVLTGQDVCECKYGAVRDAKTGGCTCGPNFMLVGSSDPAQASCKLLEVARDTRRVTIIATVCTVVPVALLVLAAAAYAHALSKRISEQTIQQLMIPEEALAIVVWGDGTVAEQTTEFGGAELTTADILSTLPPAVRASTFLKAVRVTFRGTRVWIEQAAFPAPNRRSSATARSAGRVSLTFTGAPLDNSWLDAAAARPRRTSQPGGDRSGNNSSHHRSSQGGRVPSGLRRMSEVGSSVTSQWRQPRVSAAGSKRQSSTDGPGAASSAQILTPGLGGAPPAAAPSFSGKAALGQSGPQALPPAQPPAPLDLAAPMRPSSNADPEVAGQMSPIESGTKRDSISGGGRRTTALPPPAYHACFCEAQHDDQLPYSCRSSPQASCPSRTSAPSGTGRPSPPSGSSTTSSSSALSGTRPSSPPTAASTSRATRWWSASTCPSATSSRCSRSP